MSKHKPDVPRPAIEQRWREIATEGLPPKGAWVLAWVADREFMIVARSVVGWERGEKKLLEWEDLDERSFAGATHWRELPKPPTKEPR